MIIEISHMRLTVTAMGSNVRYYQSTKRSPYSQGSMFSAFLQKLVQMESLCQGCVSTSATIVTKLLITMPITIANAITSIHTSQLLAEVLYFNC